MRSARPIVTVILVVASACASVAGPASQTESVPTESASSEAYYPLDTLTQIEQLDLVLNGVASNDPHELSKFFGYIRISCMTVVNALGGPPPCRAGEPEGTMVAVLPVLSSEGTYIYQDEVDQFQALSVKGIYAIFQNSADAYSEQYYPAGEYTILLVGSGPVAGYALRIDHGKIARLDYLLDASSFNTILERDASSFVLAPK